MSTDDETAGLAAARRAVDLQRVYLRNPLPTGDGVCTVCRSSAGAGFDTCYPCSRHRSVAGTQLADLVAPISYSIKGGQHAHNLIVYKTDPASQQARFNLSALGLLYLNSHWQCLAAAAHGPLSHVVVVPSTRRRVGTHPLVTVLARRVGLPLLTATTNGTYTADDREFHQDRFLVPPGDADGSRILLLDDTWTTGARAQSLAYSLKQAGAAAVATVVLGRHINPQYGPSKPLLDRLRKAPQFDITHCVACDTRQQ